MDTIDEQISRDRRQGSQRTAGMKEQEEANDRRNRWPYINAHTLVCVACGQRYQDTVTHRCGATPATGAAA